jgi:hypothetical protein
MAPPRIPPWLDESLDALRVATRRAGFPPKGGIHFVSPAVLVVSRMPPADKQVVKALLDGMILKHEAKRWSAA